MTSGGSSPFESDEERTDPERQAERDRERRGLVYGFLFGIVIFGGVFLYLRAGLPALLFVLACFAGMLVFSKL